MIIEKFRVREFWSIWDSGDIAVDNLITCMVGKNESGKTALLTALYRTNPIIEQDALFDETYDYPKREVEEYRYAVESGERDEVVVVECHYALDEEDLEAVADVFGDKVLKSKTFIRKTYYGINKSMFNLNVNEQAAMKYLSENPDLPDALKEKLKKCDTWEEFCKELDAAEKTETINMLEDLVSKVCDAGLSSYIYNNILWPRAPKFLYFDEYYQLEGHENLNNLIERKNNNQLKKSDRPLIGLINLARLSLDELVNVKNTTELKNKLQGASVYLTTKIMKYWSQNKHIEIGFDVRDAKPEDPVDMRKGVNIWGEVKDTVHSAQTALGSRSRGFVWFFSFLAWYEDLKREKQRVILLLDEPGLSLHGRAQGDLLNYFESELKAHQLIYTTHSPFMIDPQHFDRVRIVQDLGIDAKEPLPKKKDGTKVVSHIYDATDDTLFPLQGALGYDIHQTLFVGPNTLVVEGPSDMLYIRAISAELERENRTSLSEKWTITPVGGSGKVPTFVALLAPQKGMNVVTLLDISKKDKQVVEDLYTKKLLEKKKVLTYAEFIEKKEADIEDLFDRKFYIGLVNSEYCKQLKKPIALDQLNEKEPRILRAIEKHLEAKPMSSGEFGHYRPARYFSENINTLWEAISPETKDVFENIFTALNKLLKA